MKIDIQRNFFVKNNFYAKLNKNLTLYMTLFDTLKSKNVEIFFGFTND